LPLNNHIFVQDKSVASKAISLRVHGHLCQKIAIFINKEGGEGSTPEEEEAQAQVEN
jgi:hypothetical protein